MLRFTSLSAAALAAALTTAPAIAEEAVYITKTSAHDVETTLDRIAEAVTANGGKVFYRIDHAEAAAEYDKSMRPTQVLIFGNPANGTGLMTAHPRVSVDLPLKVGAFEAEDGTVTLIYRNPVVQFAGLGIDGPAKGIAGTLDNLTNRAVAED